ncbi:MULTISPECIES: CRISPR-associated protein Cas4 [Methylococcus]|nr:CRISPR-associated protein Cas4 [Methylococcus capsulatus]
MEETLPLSALNQYAYCPRRCYLIHAEGEFKDNVHTIRGTLEHERVDRSHSRGQGNIRIEYALPVWSDTLGLSGRCDVVEFHPDGAIYPVEYKHGKRKRWINDDLQLAAQALCLEEMTGKPVARGAIFHQQSKRRREVVITETLKQAVREAAKSIRITLNGAKCPPPLQTPHSGRCGECSLRTICEPEMVGAAPVLSDIAKTLFEPEEDLP